MKKGKDYASFLVTSRTVPPFVKCRSNNVTYQSICKTCHIKEKVRIYVSETASNYVKFTGKVLKKHFKPLERQVNEAVNINKKADDENLNSKNEFNFQTVNRIKLDKNPKLDCKVCGTLVRNKN